MCQDKMFLTIYCINNIQCSEEQFNFYKSNHRIYLCYYSIKKNNFIYITNLRNDIYDLSRYYNDFFNLANYNKHERILNAWTPQNTNTDLARVSLNDLNNNIRPSSYYVQDGSYFRLKTLQIGYTFSENITQKITASRFRVYFEAYNLFTITNYDGLDPEIGLQSYTSDDRNLDIGVDRGIYPSSQTFTFGMSINF